MELVTLLLLVVYGGGGWKFWSGYKRTNFESGLSRRVTLTVLWPLLFATNPSYRKNFQKALKGK
ncbi:hypothetical protein V0288_20375 [Pannus brasiliensis CCIBt3594]|uniref:Uncharacterized protein n=1 Tax=Pannus brasiliensis CCIBt3594 TaxID=1427578 RepID=A0AAW9QVV7_9CHRO